MANVDSRFGLTPLRHKSGAPYNGAVNPYYIPSTYGTALFIGDPVVKTGTANTAAVSAPGAGSFAIGTLPEINKSTIGDTGIMTGVIVAFAADPTALETKHNPASTERIALVCDDPDIVFEIQADGAIASTQIGLNAMLIATHGGSTVTGLSGLELDTTGTAPAANASLPLVILRQVNREDNTPNAIHNKIEVRIGLHSEAWTVDLVDGILGI